MIVNFNNYSTKLNENNNFLYYLGESLSFSSIINERNRVISEDAENVLKELNENFTGLIYIHNQDTKDCLIVNIKEYFILDNFLKGNIIEVSQNIFIENFPIYVELKSIQDSYYFFKKDTIYKIKTEEFKPKIKWFKKGNWKLEEANHHNNDVIYRLGDSIKLSTLVYYNNEIIFDSEEERNNALNLLNRDFRGFAYIHSISEDALMIYAEEYYIHNDLLRVRVSKAEEVRINSFPLSIELEEGDDDFCFSHDETLYKVETEEANPRIRWYRKGRLDDIDEAIRWYKKVKLTLDPDSTSNPYYDDFITDGRFRQFLIDNDAYDEYVDYCYIKVKNNFDRYFGRGIIDKSFLWDSTPSGHQFWENIQSEWHYVYDK